MLTLKYTPLFFLLLALLVASPNAFSQLDPLQSGNNIAGEISTTTTVGTEVVKANLDTKKSFRDLFDNEISAPSAFSGMKTEHLNPQAYSFVQDYMENHADDLYELRQTARPYFDMMDAVLTQNGIPKELKYLAVIESFLKASARSWAGAVGPWQLMPATARGLGLQVSSYRDERHDYLKSTRAASKYLNYLYDVYKDWLLVIAAYNCGPGRLNTAISKSGSNDFWSLQYYLPAESRNHVKKFIATHYIMEGKGGVSTVGKDEMYVYANAISTQELAAANVKVQTISGRYNSKAIAKHLDMPLADFAKLNPDLDRIITASSTYQLRLPLDKADLFNQKKNEMLNESIQMLLDPHYKN